MVLMLLAVSWLVLSTVAARTGPAAEALTPPGAALPAVSLVAAKAAPDARMLAAVKQTADAGRGAGSLVEAAAEAALARCCCCRRFCVH